MTTRTVPPETSPSTQTLAIACWDAARLVYPCYAALAKHADLAPPPCTSNELPVDMPPAEVARIIYDWLDAIDKQVETQQLRLFLRTTNAVDDEWLIALLQRHLDKPDSVPTKRERVELLLAHYFASCAPVGIVDQNLEFEDAIHVLEPVLGMVAGPLPGWLAPLENVLAEMQTCTNLRDLLEGGFLEQGRLVKESAEEKFYDPVALVAFTRFNFLIRRTFIRLMHADLNSLRNLLRQLESAGVKEVDCRRAGLSAAEPVSRLFDLCDQWGQPFRKNYTEHTMAQAFGPLLAIHADSEEALARVLAPSAAPQAREKALSSPASLAPENRKRRESIRTDVAEISDPAKSPDPSQLAHPPANPIPAAQNSAVTESARDAAASATSREVEELLERICEQLIAAPTPRGHSMTAVLPHNVKILLSPWEVDAVMSKGGQATDDLRRSVVARACLAVAAEEQSRSQNDAALNATLAMAQRELACLQDRVEAAKLSKDTEVAVNLGLSVRRLLSLIGAIGNSLSTTA
jgi:hypothetical protein